jgi:hypothetical protein
MNLEEKEIPVPEEIHSEDGQKKDFVEPKLERHEKLPDVTGFTF